MAGKNPYAGQYGPSRISLNKESFLKGIKGIKIKTPNRNLTTTQYKSGLKKEPESGSKA